MNTQDEPRYLETHRQGALQEKVRTALDALKACRLCPRNCGVNRRQGRLGVCNTGELAQVASYQAHFGEEAPLVGRNGSGTIFFTHCNMRCNFCQNYDISHEGRGHEVSHDTLADMMLALQAQGCHNINLVTPSHVVPHILAALERAIEGGLHIPLVYNTGGYDSVATLHLLEGVIDIYMPDFKFWDPQVAELTTQLSDYPDIVRDAIREMHRQVGDLVIDDSGIAQRGLLVRHLVMPGGLAGTPEVMRFLAQEISANTYVNVMMQYRPCGAATQVPALAQRPSQAEFQAAIQAAREVGLTRLDQPSSFIESLMNDMLWGVKGQ